MWWRSYYQTLFGKIKIEYISGSVVSYSFFFIIVCQVEGYRIILKLSGRPLAFTLYKAFPKKQKVVWN